MLPIDIKHIQYNFTNSGTKKLYIVVHTTGNTSRGADDISHYIYFNGAVRNASAHYFVDKDSITETVDPLKDSWHCGDGKGAYGITNSNSIGVEICVNSDGDYEQSVTNAIELIKYLMKRFNIDLAHVVRHWDASRKNCPSTMAANNWAKWFEFKNRVGGGSVMAVSILKVGSTGSEVIVLQKNLNLLGYNCGVADGVFGNGTLGAVKAFQQAKGLTVDGIVGAGTLAAIASAVIIKNTPVVAPPVVKPVVQPVIVEVPVIKPRYIEDILAELEAKVNKLEAKIAELAAK